MKKFIVIISVLFIGIALLVSIGMSYAHRQQGSTITRVGSCVAISASPDYLSSGKAEDAIDAINNARGYEHLHALRLPSNFYRLSAVQQQFLLVNLERTDRGLQPLQMDNMLSQMALAYSKQLHDLNFFSHTSPIAGGFTQRMNHNPLINGHYRLAAENLAGNPVAGAGAIYEYMYDDINEACGHRQNILDPDLRLIGIGQIASSIYGSISAQEFLASAAWNPYQRVRIALIEPNVSILLDNFVQHAFILIEAYTHSNFGNARITWFLDHGPVALQIGAYWGLDIHELAKGKHTIYAYVVDGMQSYAVASYTFKV